MTKSLTAKETLDITSFDPLSIDTSEIKALSKSIPKDGNIDLNRAEILATKFLRGSDLCSEVMAIAVSYVGKTESDKKRAYSNAALIKSVAAGHKTDKARAWFADMDDEYIDACNKHNTAVAFVEWIEGKYKSFEKMHYLCKLILTRGYAHERQGNWAGSIDGTDQPTDTEEKPW